MVLRTTPAGQAATGLQVAATVEDLVDPVGLVGLAHLAEDTAAVGIAETLSAKAALVGMMIVRRNALGFNLSCSGDVGTCKADLASLTRRCRLMSVGYALGLLLTSFIVPVARVSITLQLYVSDCRVTRRQVYVMIIYTVLPGVVLLMRCIFRAQCASVHLTDLLAVFESKAQNTHGYIT